jgi:dTDP-4-dehydrorhamnose 3,5-epimerase
MHYQVEPYPETKVVRCTMGAIFDVVIDLRPGSTTYRKWFSVELSAENRRALYIPDGMAHGFQTLEDNSEVYYMISEFYHPECARGIRWNDPAIGIEWPIEGKTISERVLLFQFSINIPYEQINVPICSYANCGFSYPRDDTIH